MVDLHPSFNVHQIKKVEISKNECEGAKWVRIEFYTEYGYGGKVNLFYDADIEIVNILKADDNG